MFQPSKGNVAFGSASDGWAFRLDQFADMYSAKLGAKPSALVQVRPQLPFLSNCACQLHRRCILVWSGTLCAISRTCHSMAWPGIFFVVARVL